MPRSCHDCVFAEIRKTLLRDDVNLVSRIWCTCRKMIREGWEAEYCPYFIRKSDESSPPTRNEEDCLQCRHLVLVPQRTSTGDVLVPYCRLTGEIVSPKEGRVCPMFRKREVLATK